MISKIGLFVYDFPHAKSNRGMQLINTYFSDQVEVFGAPKVKLNHKKSKYRVAVKDTPTLHPFDIAKSYGWNYHSSAHNTEKIEEIIKKNNLQIGIILGARILSDNLISSFEKGIINFHPGLLPQNRGLDNIKWAIYDNIQQGVTTHFINKFVDAGEIIYREIIDVQDDDTVFDINQKLLDKQFEHLLRLLKTNFEIEDLIKVPMSIKPRTTVSENIDEIIISKFVEYKNSYELDIK
tara:strand:+ start:4334 stop:5044 length:711 start_codon:yes stop_codon:yes gene_type:complete